MKPFQILGESVIISLDTHYTQKCIKELNKLNKDGFCTKHHYVEYTFKGIKKHLGHILKQIEGIENGNNKGNAAKES